MYSIAVVGAGAVGLCSAVNVQREFPQAKVTVIADKFTKDTTSFGAGGLFKVMVDPTQPDYELKRESGATSWRFFQQMVSLPPPDNAGVCSIYCNALEDTPMDERYSLQKELSHDFQKLSKEALEKQGFSGYKYGCSYTTFIVQTPYYLDWLTQRFLEKGGTIQSRKVGKLEELCGHFDLVINCCGLGAKELADDPDVYPVKGQAVYVRAPWMKQAYFANSYTYVLPQQDRVFIGVTRAKGRSDLSVDAKVTEDIFHRVLKLVPQLKGAEVIGTWAGVRPSRDCIRVELERVPCGSGGRVLPVVHNYGHGPIGICLSWGTAVKAASLARNALFDRTSRL